MRILGRVILALLIVGGAVFYGGPWILGQYFGRVSQSNAFWEDQIAAFEEADRLARPDSKLIIFTGSSSIRLWSTLERDMAPLSVLNRGFGGSQMSHLLHYAPRIILPRKPAAIVVYEGDNDIGFSAFSGKSADDVLREYKEFVALVHAELPETHIYFLSIKPSIARWNRWSEMARANSMIEEWSQKDVRLSYIDCASILLGEDGLPRNDVFLADGLHLNSEGYRLWTKRVHPVLMQGTHAELQGNSSPK